MVEIRDETAADHDEIDALLRVAFGGAGEARLVERLRADGVVVAALVATTAGRVVGHVLFSALPIALEHGEIVGAALAPLAVAVDWRRRGVGAALVRAGLARGREQGWGAVVVVGDPAYYGRFGFSAALARDLRSPYAGEACLAIELAPGVLGNGVGTVRYPAAFALVDCVASRLPEPRQR